MTADQTWIFAVLMEDVPGSLMDVLSAFSYRGVSIESVLGFGRPICGTGCVILGISCSEKRAHEIERVVRRLPVVSMAHKLEAPRSSSHRMVLIEQLKGREPPHGEDLQFLSLTNEWTLVTGPEPDIRRFLRGSIDRGEVGKHVEVLIA
jgi:hypothetical protein